MSTVDASSPPKKRIAGASSRAMATVTAPVGWLRRWFDRWFGSSDPLSEQRAGLTQQYVLTLRAMFTAHVADDVRSGDRGKRVQELLEQDQPAWRDAHEAEVLLANLMNPTTVRVELERRLIEAERVLHSDTAAFYQRYRSVGGAPPEVPIPADELELRALYSRLLNDLQWRYSVKQQKHGLYRETSRNTIVAFLVVLGVVCLGAVVAIQLSNGIVAPVAAALAGVLGASFSMLVGLRNARESGIDDLKVTSRPGYTLSRLCIGICAGLVMCVALQTGFIEGGVFPKKDDGLSLERATNVATTTRLELAALLTRTVPPAGARAAEAAAGKGGKDVKDAKGAKDAKDGAPGAGAAPPPAATEPSLDKQRAALADLHERWVSRLQLPLGTPEACAAELVSQATEVAPTLTARNADGALDATVTRILVLASDHGATLALLLLWGFLAGFSERLVPNLLNRRSQEASGNQEAPPPVPAG